MTTTGGKRSLGTKEEISWMNLDSVTLTKTPTYSGIDYWRTKIMLHQTQLLDTIDIYCHKLVTDKACCFPVYVYREGKCVPSVISNISQANKTIQKGLYKETFHLELKFCGLCLLIDNTL